MTCRNIDSGSMLGIALEFEQASTYRFFKAGEFGMCCTAAPPPLAEGAAPKSPPPLDAAGVAAPNMPAPLLPELELGALGATLHKYRQYNCSSVNTAIRLHALPCRNLQTQCRT